MVFMSASGLGAYGARPPIWRTTLRVMSAASLLLFMGAWLVTEVPRHFYNECAGYAFCDPPPLLPWWLISLLALFAVLGAINLRRNWPILLTAAWLLVFLGIIADAILLLFPHWQAVAGPSITAGGVFAYQSTRPAAIFTEVNLLLAIISWLPLSRRKTTTPSGTLTT